MHEIEIGTDGIGKFIYSETPAWHGLGQKIEADWDRETMLRHAGHLPVSVEPMTLANGVPVDSHICIVRADGKQVGVMKKDSYVPTQASDLWASTVDKFTAQGLAKIETAGSLRDGARIFVTAKIQLDPSVVIPGDEIEHYLLCATSFDGSLANLVGFTDTRVVCANTLRMAMDSEASKLMRIKHTKNSKDAIDLLSQTMDLAMRDFQANAEQYKAMTKLPFNDDDLRKYVQLVFTPGKQGDDSAKRLVKDILPLFESGRGSDIPGVRGTLWGAYNAVTEYLTHHRGHSEATRLESLWFGPAANQNERAFSCALQLLKAA